MSISEYLTFSKDRNVFMCDLYGGLSNRSPSSTSEMLIRRLWMGLSKLGINFPAGSKQKLLCQLRKLSKSSSWLKIIFPGWKHLFNDFESHYVHQNISRTKEVFTVETIGVGVSSLYLVGNFCLQPHWRGTFRRKKIADQTEHFCCIIGPPSPPPSPSLSSPADREHNTSDIWARCSVQ